MIRAVRTTDKWFKMEKENILPPGPGSEMQSASSTDGSEASIGERRVFEDMFHDPLTQKAAWQLFHEHSENYSSELMDIPSEYLSAPKSCKITTTEDGEETVSRLRPRLKQVTPVELLHKSKKMKASAIGGSKVVKSELLLEVPAKPVPEVPAPDDTNGSDNEIAAGREMVQALLDRYETSKQKYKTKGRKKAAMDSDSSDLEEISDEELEFGAKSDFFKHSIPQFELKEKLYQKHYINILSMTALEVRKLCEQVIPDLKAIMDGTVSSNRHEMFKSEHSSKQSLRNMTVSKPFCNAHDSAVMDTISAKMFYSEGEDLTDRSGELLHYIGLVLVPEALIRIFSKANSIDYDLAEKELRFGAAYDGELATSILKTIPKEK